MEVRKLKLVDKKEVAAGTTSFYFEKPSDFIFKAGQYFDLALLDPPETDSAGDVRTFSISSAPHDPYITITTRIRDTAFKRVLSQLPMGSEVEMRGMGGSFTLHNKAERPAVFIAGGIGITPFRSMLVDAAHRGLPHRIILLWSNRRPGDTPFLDELHQSAEKNLRYSIVPTMTDLDELGESWGGEVGRITPDMIKKYTSNTSQPIYYIAGSMDFVNAMRSMIEGMGIDSDDIRSEDFPGY